MTRTSAPLALRLGPLGALLGLAALPMLAGCTEPLDAEGQAAAAAAATVTGGLEATCTTGSLLTKVDLSRGANREAAEAAARVINDVFGKCVQAEVLQSPAVGVKVSFPGGCGIPLTTLRFAGSLTVAFLEQGGATTLSLQLAELQLLDYYLDGELALTASQGAFSYVVTKLRVRAQGEDVLLDGRGRLSSVELHTAVEFDGTGMLTRDGTTIGFIAEKVVRDYDDCYPESGRVTVERTGSDGVPRRLTITFSDDSEDAGTVELSYGGVTREWDLPARACTDR